MHRVGTVPTMSCCHRDTRWYVLYRCVRMKGERAFDIASHAVEREREIKWQRMMVKYLHCTVMTLFSKEFRMHEKFVAQDGQVESV
jgi:hypothetical protein